MHVKMDHGFNTVALKVWTAQTVLALGPTFRQTKLLCIYIYFGIICIFSYGTLSHMLRNFNSHR